MNFLRALPLLALGACTVTESGEKVVDPEVADQVGAAVSTAVDQATSGAPLSEILLGVAGAAVTVAGTVFVKNKADKRKSKEA